MQMKLTFKYAALSSGLKLDMSPPPLRLGIFSRTVLNNTPTNLSAKNDVVVKIL